MTNNTTYHGETMTPIEFWEAVCAYTLRSTKIGENYTEEDRERASAGFWMGLILCTDGRKEYEDVGMNVLSTLAALVHAAIDNGIVTREDALRADPKEMLFPAQTILRSLRAAVVLGYSLQDSDTEIDPSAILFGVLSESMPSHNDAEDGDPISMDDL